MSRTFKTNAPELNWSEVDGQMQKVISIQDRRRAYATLRKHGIAANGSIWTRFTRRVTALFY